MSRKNKKSRKSRTPFFKCFSPRLSLYNFMVKLDAHDIGPVKTNLITDLTFRYHHELRKRRKENHHKKQYDFPGDVVENFNRIHKIFQARKTIRTDQVFQESLLKIL